MILAICWDTHHQASISSKNELFISIKHEISAVNHFNVSLQTNKQTTSDWLTANGGSFGITCNRQLYAAGWNLSRMSELTVIHSIVTYSLLYIAQNFPLFTIIFLTVSRAASHGSPKTSVLCDRIRIEPKDGRCIEHAPGSDTPAMQKPISPPWRCNCSH